MPLDTSLPALRPIRRLLGVLFFGVLILGCSRSSPSTLGQLDEIEHDYKLGSEKVWLFRDVDRSAPKEERQKIVAADIMAESRRVAELSARVRALSLPARYNNLREAYEALYDADSRIEAKWSVAIASGHQGSEDFPGELAGAEFAASSKILDAKQALGMDVRTERRRLDADQARFESFKKARAANATVRS